jgi:hypothetical protein
MNSENLCLRCESSKSFILTAFRDKTKMPILRHIRFVGWGKPNPVAVSVGKGGLHFRMFDIRIQEKKVYAPKSARDGCNDSDSGGWLLGQC